MPNTPPHNAPRPAGSDRLQLVLARSGVASRRHAAGIIASGRVTVNGETITEPGFRVNPGSDAILLDGAPLPAVERPRTILLNKPPGVVCSTDTTQGRSVCELVDLPERLVPVGRLDKESEGLLLLSNDGAFIQRMTHPRHGHTKTYEVTVVGRLSAAAVRSLGEPIELDGYLTRPARVRVLSAGDTCHLVAITLSEGRNRQIRHLCARAGFHVVRLVRTAIGGLTAPALKPGAWRALTPADLKRLDA
ncbi:MAG: rRNA pseudouridine synthase [Lentisphaerae bacterium]|nr:rRNA pseudouridine synthase [Lentisphaerota bacterium]